MDDAVEDRARDRIRWHARRGLLENDLILTRFLDAQLATLDTAEMALLEELLRWGDNDLLDVLMERKQCDDLRFSPLIERIKAAQN
jgi:succinate dehydrogenase flavin-adding protein (antitoxin of CptAB toxin-antitoxin module)